MKFDLAELMHHELSLTDGSMQKESEIVRAMDSMARAANLLEDCGLIKEAEKLTSIMEKIAKDKPKGEFIFSKTHPKVTDKKDHLPINTEGRGRNALARANQFSKAPTWYKGSLQEFVNAVTRAVKSKYKGIEVSEKAKKPGKG